MNGQPKSQIIDALVKEAIPVSNSTYSDYGYSDYTDHSDSPGWSDNWNDGPNHSDTWSDSSDD